MSKNKETIDELLEEVLLPEDGQTHEVPANWIWVKSEFVAKWGSGGTPSRKNSEYYNGNIPWLKTGELRDTVILDSEEKITEEGLKKSSAKLFPKDSVAIAMYGATIGKLGILGIDAATNQACAVGVPYALTDKKFMFYYFLTQRKNLIDKGKGGAQPNISQTIIKEFPYILPPINEQNRIADKVENLLNKIEEAKQLIEEAKKTFELRRAAILDKAFRGELTRKWRGENADITTANEWIEQINLLKEGTKTKYKDQLDSSILEKLYELPREWKWVRLNDLIEASTYGTSAKTNDDVTGTPVLRMGNIVDGYLELNNLKYLPNNHEDVLKYDLQTNDLLFNRTNSYELVGKTSVITEDVSERFTFASYLIRVRLFYKDFLASYVSHYINSHVGRKILLSMVTQQVGQANINSQKLASLPIPLPSQEEVMEITSWLNNYRELESKQKEMILVEENTEALKQSILSKAFRGELGTNDLGEESAIELLKDVLQEQVK
ncbi:restriction endonuclease subunit S [Bacillus altitudinis]|uniref:restriction endonuclease subunit S n=1 Tax=Bacillus altitudinis TaxID=293387 RepID=UPI003D7A057E